MSTDFSMASSDSDVFYVEQSSNEPSPQRNNSPNILNSTELSEHPTAGMPSNSSIASPEPLIFLLLMMIQMNPRCHLDLDGSSRLSHQA